MIALEYIIDVIRNILILRTEARSNNYASGEIRFLPGELRDIERRIARASPTIFLRKASRSQQVDAQEKGTPPEWSMKVEKIWRFQAAHLLQPDTCRFREQ